MELFPKDQRSWFLSPNQIQAIEYSDFHIIRLMSHVTQLLLEIILARMKEKINVEVAEEKLGYQQNSGTRGNSCRET